MRSELNEANEIPRPRLRAQQSSRVPLAAFCCCQKNIRKISIHPVSAQAAAAAAPTTSVNLVEEGGGARGVEGGAERLGGSPLDAVGKRELDLGVDELLDGRPLDGRGHVVAVELRVVPPEGADTGGDDASVDDLDGLEPGAVTTGKLRVHLGDGAAEGDVTELLVHVVGTGARVVADGDAVVLDDVGVALPDLVDGKDLTSGLLHLVKLVEEIPAGTEERQRRVKDNPSKETSWMSALA
jgi:hypothetical protein